MNVQNQRQYAIPADIRFHAGNHKWNASRGSVRLLYGVDHIFFSGKKIVNSNSRYRQ